MIVTVPNDAPRRIDGKRLTFNNVTRFENTWTAAGGCVDARTELETAHWLDDCWRRLAAAAAWLWGT